MRLSPPTGKTFWPAVGALALGIVLWVVPTGADLSPDIPFWLTAAGGILLALGSVFNKI
jgi:hypothetical protein